jgi:Flp pilus assembly protein CpaB
MVTMHADDSGARAGLLTLADLHSSQNLVAAVLIHSGDPITRSEIVRSAGPTGLASMSLPVPVAHANGGSIVVGDRVDVIGHGTGVAEYVARGLQVLAVAPASSSSGLGASTSNSTFYIVVAVDSDTALRLSQALGNSNTGGAVDVIRTTGVPNDQQPTPTILSPLATSAGSTSHPPTTQAGR